MSGFDDDFLSVPAPSAKGAAASPSPPAPMDDFDAFVSAPASTEQSSGFLSPEAASAAKATADALKAKSGAALATAAQASAAGAQRLRAAVARVTPKQWGIAVGGLALVVGLTFAVRWWMERPASPVVAAAKTEAPIAPAASIAAVAPTPVVTAPVPQKQTVPVTAATLPAAPAIAPASPPPTAVVHTAPRPVVVSPKKDPWQVAHAADIHKSMQQHTEKADDAWAKDQSARLDAFFKKKH